MTPIQAYEKAKLLGQRLPELENCIITSCHYSYFYAIDIIKGRWPEAEDTIMESQKLSLLYAVFVIKGRLPEKMHNMMILYAVQDSKDWAAEYFRFLEGKTTHIMAYKQTDRSRNSSTASDVVDGIESFVVGFEFYGRPP